MFLLPVAAPRAQQQYPANLCAGGARLYREGRREGELLERVPGQAIIERHPWLPYVAPFALFAGLTGLQPYVPGGVAWVYPAKTVLTGLLILGVRRWLVPGGDWSVPAAAVTGLLVLVLWIL